MQTISFEQMPQALQKMQATIEELNTKLDRLEANQPVNEPPIDTDELCRRLNISRPTALSMRNRKKFPFMVIGGHYRYNWQQVLKSLTK